MKPASAIEILSSAELATPAFVYDERQLVADAAATRAALRGDNVRVLHAMKAFAVPDALRLLAEHLDGLHASSLFEARLARSVLGERGLVHVTSPGLRLAEAPELFGYSDLVSFNSIGQWERFRAMLPAGLSSGIRVNPRLSRVEDARYDPCRQGSKLGVPIDRLGEMAARESGRLRGLEGLLVHGNCDATDMSPILETVVALDAKLGPLMARIKWLNLGGGYLFQEADDLTPLTKAIEWLSERFDFMLLFEPGAALVRAAGYLVASVVDLFRRDGEDVAVLDTTVNHLPEVFEYQYHHEVEDEAEEDGREYVLAGATCLAGDLFGRYRLEQPLDIGSRVIFVDAGAYSLVKASMFNGINLPTVYAIGRDNALTLKKRFTYRDFLMRCGAQDPNDRL